MPIKQIASWNVNSLKIRQTQVIDYLDNNPIDIFALQELKQTDDAVDANAFNEKSFHINTFGQKTYNGVALISRSPQKDIEKNMPNFPDDQARLIAATIDDWRIVNVYVPNGKAIDDEKYIYKINWLNGLIEYLKIALTKYSRLILLGDFNIAPDNLDVHDPTKWQDKILCSKKERELLQQILSLGLIDSFRQINQEKQQFSWWDYRMNSYKRNNGMRIDLALVSDKKSLIDATIDEKPRQNDRPSDHTPIIIKVS